MRQGTRFWMAAGLAVSGMTAAASAQLVSPWTGQPAPMAVCFAKGTSQEYMDAVNRLNDAQNAFFGTGAGDYHIGATWPVAQGTPLNLTWSFVPDGLAIPGGDPSEIFAVLDAAYAGVGGRAAWIAKFQQVFDRWAALTGVRYTRVKFNGAEWDDGAVWGSAGLAGKRGDVRISMHAMDGPFGVLAVNGYPTSGDMRMDSDDVAIWSDSTGQYVEFRNTIAHEHGHGLGLAHTCSLNSNVLMQPTVGGVYDGPQQDDIRGAQRNYGDTHESNETAPAAKPMGTVGVAGIVFGNVPNPPSGMVVPNAAALSIDAAGKVDWFSFATSTTIPVGIKVQPVGSIYDDSAQGGGCPPTPNNINALNIADLALQVYSNSGATLIGTGTAAGLGVAENITVGPLAPGTYHVKVSASNTPTSTQLYRIELTCPKPSLNTPLTPKTGNAGDVLTMTVSAANATQYRWRKDGVSLVDAGHISGAGTATLRLSPLKMGDAGMYSVSLTNGCGNTVTPAVQLTVNCWPNCDGSTALPILNAADFTCFLTKFSVGDPWCNCDGSAEAPILNILDFGCFMEKMAAGCP